MFLVVNFKANVFLKDSFPFQNQVYIGWMAQPTWFALSRDVYSKNTTGIFLAVGRSLTKPPPQLPPKLAVDFEAMGDGGKVNRMGCPVS